ncbi:MAG: hypothetical protein FWE53_00820 [Firmicutes bacterium]|nr:hypothetical protein [Bacillota bacterium]
MNKICGWNASEAKQFFEYLKTNKNQALKAAFNNYALQAGRSANSVRNFYYAAMQSKAAGLCDGFNVNTGRTFSENETEGLITEILQAGKNGESARSVCNRLAGGDLKQATRLQNKYRNTALKNPGLIKALSDKFGVNTGKASAEAGKFDNVIKMPVSSGVLTDNDIKNLFLGLVRLVKRHAAEEVSLNLKRECEFANSTLRNTLIDLRRKDRFLEELKEQNNMLTAKLRQASNDLIKLRSENLEVKLKAEEFAGSKKVNELREFLAGLKQTSENINLSK